MTFRPPVVTPRIVPYYTPPPTTGRVGSSGIDKQFRGPGQWTTYDYPNPRGYEFPISLRTWIDPVKIWLIGKDKQFAGAGQWKSYDYPNPRGYIPGIDLITWVWPVQKQLIGKDTQFRGFGQWQSYDYPNPGIPGRSLDALTWTQNLLQNTLKPGVQAPFTQTDWPNPRGYISPLWTWTQNALNVAPFRLLDWPNPLSPTGLVDLRTWVQNLSQTTLTPGQAPFSLLNWPNPPGADFSIVLRSFFDPNYIANPIPQPAPPPPAGPAQTGGGRWYGYYPSYEEKERLETEIEEVVEEKKAIQSKLSFSPNREELYRLIDQLNSLQKRLDTLTTEYVYLIESWKTYRGQLEDEEEEFILFISANL